MKRHSYLGGVFSSFSALCCAGTPLLLAFLTGIGLGFVINDFILFPLLFISIGFMFYSMRINKKKHVNNKPIMIAIVSAILILAGIWLTPLLWIGIAGLLVSTIWDFILIKKCKVC